MKEYSFIIDTDSYAGNFERHITAYVTGRHFDMLEGGYYLDALSQRYVDDLGLKPKRLSDLYWADKIEGDPLSELIVCRAVEHDGSYFDDFCEIEPTPGWVNDGMGRHYREEDVPEKVKKKGGWPAYQTVAIFLSQKPTDEQLEFMKKRALEYPKTIESIEEHKIMFRSDDKIKILGFRLKVEDRSSEYLGI